MPADSGKLAENAQDLVQWILDQALDGIGPLPSASDLVGISVKWNSDSGDLEHGFRRSGMLVGA